MATGYSQTRGGHGFLIIHGDERLFIMAVGTLINLMDLFGFRIMNGAPDGLPGEDQEIITDGRQ
jgi:hypothetical protein